MWPRKSKKKHGDTEAKRALKEAEEHLREAKAREVEVHELATASKTFRRENHFSKDLQAALFGHGGGLR